MHNNTIKSTAIFYIIENCSYFYFLCKFQVVVYLCLYSTFHKVELIILFVEMIAAFVTDNHLLFVNDTNPDFPIFTEEGESCLCRKIKLPSFRK